MRLPVYQNQASIQANFQPQAPDNSAMVRDATAVAGMMQQWQNIKDESIWLAGKNETQRQITGILAEANDYHDYKNASDIANKEKELTDRMNKILPEVVKGFGNEELARRFTDDYQLAIMTNGERLKGEFRRKYIDNFAVEIHDSEVNNMNSFIQSGNAAYKDSYINDLTRGHKAGLLSADEYAKGKASVEGWNKFYIQNEAEKNPQAFIDAVNRGEYKGYNVDTVTTALHAAERERRWQEYGKHQTESNQLNDMMKQISGMTQADQNAFIQSQRGLMDDKLLNSLQQVVDNKWGVNAVTQKDTHRKILLDMEMLKTRANELKGSDDVDELEGLINDANQIFVDMNHNRATNKLTEKDYNDLLKAYDGIKTSQVYKLQTNDKGQSFWKKEFTYSDAYEEIKSRTPNAVFADEIFYNYVDSVMKVKGEKGLDFLSPEVFKPILNQLINDAQIRRSNLIIQKGAF